MSLRSALGWGVLQSTLRLAIGFFSIKVTAVYLGAGGLALVGQINNFLTFAQGGVGSALQTGVVKLTAESSGDRHRQLAVCKTGILLSTVVALPLSVLVGVFSGRISEWLFHTDLYQMVILLAAPCLTLIVWTYVFNAILNGLQLKGSLSVAQMVAMIVSALIFIPAVYFWGIRGALFGAVIALASGAVVTLPFLFRAGVFSLAELRRAQVEPGLIKQLLAFFPMLMVNSAIPPLGLILVRDLLGNQVGLEAAGQWQATWRLSEMYLLMLTTGLSLHLMPHLSIKRDVRQFSNELLRSVGQVSALALVAAFPMILFREQIVSVVFTAEFSAVKNLIVWQLIGDVFRMAAWPLRMTLVIRQRSLWYISLELLMPLLHLAGVYLLLPKYGLSASVFSYALAVLVSDLLLIYSLRDILFLRTSVMLRDEE
jgi:PST family polysaccharide transporter